MAPARRGSAGSRVLAVAEGVAWLTLPRPRVDQASAQALCSAAEEIAVDGSVCVVVVQGSGGQFCIGVDGAGDWEARHDWVAAIASLAAPVVAAIGGDAIGEGAELALACDLQVANMRARIGFPHLAEGRLPRHGATQRLPRAVGRLRAMDLLLSGRVLRAAEGGRIGLLSHVVPDRGFAKALREVVEGLRAKGPIATRLAKEAVRQGVDLTLDQGIRLEQDLYVLLQTTADRREGINAFLAKRRPHFHGS